MVLHRLLLPSLGLMKGSRPLNMRRASSLGSGFRRPVFCLASSPILAIRRRLFSESNSRTKDLTSTMSPIPSYQHHPGLPGVNLAKATARTETTAFILFEALWEAGVRYCFVNVGSDHPSILEAIVKGKRERRERWPRIITCPSEVTAISMADGYARITGQPQAVIAHVDVGTQALGQGVHNASVGRIPVFIFAGLCPYTESGELVGSRTEYMHWLQEAPDQKAIVRQYCRYTGEIRTGLNAKQTIARALQFAKSDPKGPVYIASAREVLAEEVAPYSLDQDMWTPIAPAALPAEAAEDITSAILQAKRPLVLTGYTGRDSRCLKQLTALADLIPSLRVHDTGGSDVCFPASHPASEGFRLSTHDCTKDADLVLILNCDVPWIPSRNPPPKDARIYHIDVDPLNQQIPVSFFPAHGRWKADCFTALSQLVSRLEQAVSNSTNTDIAERETQLQARAQAHEARMKEIQDRLHTESEDSLNADNIGYLLKTVLPRSTTYVVEAVTCSLHLSDQLQPDAPRQWINCGATGIGWSNGASLGIRLALEDEAQQATASAQTAPSPPLVVQLVGDGSFMCAAPASALWVARKYAVPILTIVLNNGGWRAPRNSASLVYPDGLNKHATGDELNISFRPSPDYAGLAVAASGGGGSGSSGSSGSSSTADDPASGGEAERENSWMRGVKAHTVGDLVRELQHAQQRVQHERRGMLIEAVIT